MESLAELLEPVNLLGTIAIYVIFVIAEWKIFTKAGEAGWKSLIPVYNVLVQLKFTWKRSALLWFVVFCFGFGFGSAFMLSLDATKAIIGALITIICGIGILILTIRIMYYLAVSFGHGFLFTIGLILLPNIFTLILAFGRSRYVGNGYLLRKNRKMFR